MSEDYGPQNPRERGNLGELYKVLDEAFPFHRDKEGYLDLRKLGADLVGPGSPAGVSRQAIYKWTKREKLPAKRAKQIALLSEGRLTLKDLEKFVFL